jgi:DNA-binding transcriptional LysR family regulator
MLNLNQLRVFYCVAKNLSFTKAAEELFITQPAVTAQVKHFEECCELKLFKKKGRGICLTDEGETLHSYARQLFEYEKRVEGALDDLRQLKQGVLRIGTTKTYVRYLMPHMMRLFHEKFPEIKIFLDEGSSLAMINSLTELKNEIAIITPVAKNPDVEFIPFAKEEVIPILSPDHPLAKQPNLSVEQCAQEPVIMREVGSGTRKFINDLFKQHHCTPNVLMESANSEFIKHLVGRGDGISFLVKESAHQDLQEKKLISIPFKDGKVHLDVSVAYLKKQPLSLTAQAFLKALDELVSEERPINGIRSLLSKQTIDA